MDDMIERVARAAYGKWREQMGSGAGFPPWDETLRTTRELWVAGQRAAIEAYKAALAEAGLVIVPREPTEEMLAAGGTGEPFNMPAANEQVRRSLIAYLGDTGDWLIENMDKDDVTGLTRALIEALRAPTEAMLDAGMGHDPGTPDDPWTLMDGEGYAPAFNSRNVWHAMIDAALGPAQDETVRKGTGVMDELIVRLELATEGSRELDAGIFSVIEGRKISVRQTGAADDPGIESAPCYTTSLDAALTLWPDGYIELRRFSDGWYAKASARSKEIDRIGNGHRKPAAIALCIAALKARAGPARFHASPDQSHGSFLDARI